jgi:hypothetical protein
LFLCDLSGSSPASWVEPEKEFEMALDRVILAFAGFMVLLSVALGVYISPYWHLLTVFVGLNLIQSAFTGFCPAAIIFKKVGVKPGNAFN